MNVIGKQEYLPRFSL